MVPILGFVAYSGTGKTTLLLKIIPLLKAKGLRIGMIKHSHHRKFDIDHPGKDSYRLREAGAEQMLVASRQRWALMVEQADQDIKKDPELAELLPNLKLDDIDLILVEGFKHERISKIELHRPVLNKPLLYPEDRDIIAIASDHENLQDLYPGQIQCPLLNINNSHEISLFIASLLLNKESNKKSNKESN